MRIRYASTAAALALMAFTGPGHAQNAPAPAAAPPRAPAPHGARPNIVFILVDDMGWRDLGVTGSTFYETPAIDALARDGMRFTNAHSAYPRCVPSRYAILTGRNPARGQVPGGPESIKASDYTIAEALHDNGYATFFAGKWHEGKTPATQPQAQGFDINIGGSSAGMTGTHFFPYNAGKHILGPGLETGKPGEYLADRLTDETIKFLDEHQRTKPDQPFLVYLSHYGVHTPLEGKPELVEKFKKKLAAMGGPKPDGYLQRDGETKKYQDDPVYAAMIASIDESVGRVRAELERLGIADNTLIVFTSDNGGLSNRGEHTKSERPTSNLPLRAGKGHDYEGGLAIPMIVRWPGHTKAGSVTSQFTVNSDHYPSLLAAAGLPLQPKVHVDGISYLPVLAGGKMPADRIIYWYSPRPRTRQTGDKVSGAIRIGDWKYYLSFDPSVPSELFNLATDPYEKTDLSAKQSARAADLKGKLTAWLASVHALAPVPEAAPGEKVGKKGKRGEKAGGDDDD
ncbi:sulfatase [Sphingomonas sp. R-74633]|uniref:sulfatase n=1 Tax=Sphingomonas sp. R-74633 TaxID=2751188 RepID=UPI0015D285BB|nr:sulfatase [Sphingomonas sp. R-74633]NYT40668.1 sulfatase [Sphingomonas sp. R-74633]